MPLSRVERFAYPVLLERARAAELAQKAHPVRADGPAVETLIDIVTAAFTERGHTLENAEWDAWKDEKGFWVAQLQWQNGRSEIAAHWRYQPDAHGGSVSPLDDPASDLIDPDFGRALRGLATILPPQVEIEAPVAPEPPVETRPVETRPTEARPARETAAAPARTSARSQPTLDEYYEQRSVAAGGSGAPVSAGGAAAAIPAAASTNAIPAAGGSAAAAAGTTTTPAAGAAPTAPASGTGTAPSAPTVPAKPAAEEAPKTKAAPAKAARNKRGKAPMPSWEDVLLGVRSSGH